VAIPAQCKPPAINPKTRNISGDNTAGVTQTSGRMPVDRNPSSLSLISKPKRINHALSSITLRIVILPDIINLFC
jgi:hypothetical protein